MQGIGTVSSLSRNRLALTAFGAAAAGAAIWWVWPSGPWTVARAGGASCRLEAGTARPDVLVRCGAPDATGGQPKRGRSGPELINMCAAPCDRYGDKVLFFDCDNRLAEVEGWSSHYQGCVGVEARD
jgi:hypothetical protein